MIVVANALVSFVIVFALFTAFLVITGNFPGISYLAIFPVLLVMTLFAIGLGVTLGVLNVFFRDVGQFFGIVLNFWFWLTPIVYSVNILPDSVKSAMRFNPMAPVIQSFQVVLVQRVWPDWQALWLPAVLGIVLCLLAWACSASMRAKWWMNSDGHHYRYQSGQGLQAVPDTLVTSRRVDGPASQGASQAALGAARREFSVRAGEAIGIIGINGAGKSTLLKMIVGTTQPTVGSVSMTGRVAALLGSGWGFIRTSPGART